MTERVTTVANSAPPSDTPVAQTLMGARVRRVEDGRLTSGRGRYLDDLLPAGTLHLRLVRSQYAHAEITGVRIGEWEEPPPGTVFFTGSDLPDLGMRADVRDERWQKSVQPLIARDVTRYVGEPVAAVLHEDPYIAEDAAEMVSVEYTPREPVTSLEQALADNASRVHEGWKDNLFIRNLQTFGDIDAARDEATHVVRRAFRTHRQAGVPLEGRGVIAVPDPNGQGVTIWSSTQMPHLVRTYAATELGLPENAVRVIAPDVGGGFGIKGHVFGEEVLVPWLALKLGRPVKWVEDRVEHMLSSVHARDHLHLVEAYTNDAGRVLGMRLQVVVDAGAYSVYPWTANSDAGMVAKVILGPYNIPTFQAETMAVATNKCPLGTYRGVGRPSAVFTMERLMDEIGRDLGIDPADVRRENVIREFPHRTPHGLEYDPGSYAESLEQALERVGYAERRESGKPDGAKLRGYGIALYNEQTAHGTPDFTPRKTPIETGYESVLLRMESDGSVVVYTGLQSHGQGHETTFAQVVADELGVPMSTVRVIHGDTGNSPYAVGTWGSRGAVLGGGAAARAARMIRHKLLTIASQHLECDPAAMTIENGVIHATGTGSSIPVATIAYYANRRADMLPPGIAPGLEASVVLDGPPRGTFSNSCHVAVVDVDTRSGHVDVIRYVVVEDCGVMINPMIVDGQVQGGVVQGIGSALLEEFIYSADGQPLTSTFMDYLLPTATSVPDIEVYHLVTPSPWTEHGMKGMGEAGAIGPMAAVANAISDALGACVPSTPLRPHRVWSLIKDPGQGTALWDQWCAHPALSSFWPTDA